MKEIGECSELVKFIKQLYGNHFQYAVVFITKFIIQLDENG